MGVFDKDLFGKSKHETAIARIRTFCEGKRTLVAFSGGKDSQCCYHLCQEAGIEFTAQYSITRFEPPELLQFIRANYPDVSFRRAYTRTLTDEIRVNGLPTRWHRYCCKAKHKRTPGFDITVVGVRFEESPRRRDSWRMSGSKEKGTFYICPICDWSTEDVWEYLNARGIPHCCLYDPPYNLTRIGCVCCPLAPTKMRTDAEMWPKTANMLYKAHCLNWEYKWNLVRTKRNGNLFQEFKDFSTPKEAFDYWLKTGALIRCCETTDEPCLFAGTGFSESDGAGEAAEDGSI